MGIDNIKLCGGRLCLDFANTAGDHQSEHPSEHLATFADLVTWSTRAGILGDESANKLLAEARRQPSNASRILRSAIRLRESIFHIFSAASLSIPPKRADLDHLNKWLQDSRIHLNVALTRRGYEWQWDDAEEPNRMLCEVARSAADLLTSSELNRVSQCDNAPCGWLFLDTSKNHSRRWCDMSDCGNRVKARRHYGRVRAARTRKSGETGGKEID